MTKNKPTQEELRNFVSNNVYYNQSYLVEEMLKNEVFNYDDIINLYQNTCLECEKIYNNISDLCPICETELEQEPQEIYEWWLVNDWLLEKLIEKNEPVLKNDYGCWWGRTSTGQAIYLDNIIEEIYQSNLKQ